MDPVWYPLDLADCTLEPTARRGGVESSPDSPLEGTGFEPSVPRERLVLSFSFTPTFPLARVNRPDPISESILRPCDQGARPCRHHRRDHFNGLLTSNDPGLLRRPGRGAGNGALRGARSQSPGASGESSRNGFGHRPPPIRIAEHSRDPGACRSYHGPVSPACHPGYAEREAARRFHKSDPFSRIDLILRG